MCQAKSARHWAQTLTTLRCKINSILWCQSNWNQISLIVLQGIIIIHSIIKILIDAYCHFNFFFNLCFSELLSQRVFCYIGTENLSYILFFCIIFPWCLSVLIFFSSSHVWRENTWIISFPPLFLNWLVFSSRIATLKFY